MKLSKIKYGWKILLKKSGLYIKLFGCTVLLAIILRTFVFLSFTTPGSSMEPAILDGDYVFVNKLIYGPRIIKNFKFMNGGKFETFRIKGFSKVKHNDIIVFNYPYSQWGHLQPDLDVYAIKRCVALPGDTFYIEDGIYRVNRSDMKLGYYPYQEEIAKIPDNVLPDVIFNCFPQNDNYAWNIKEFGQLYVPKSGDNLPIDTLNYLPYKNLIEYETGRKISIRNGTVCLDDQLLNQYTFKLNCYFVSGDNIFNSKDSRYWGLLPEDHIVGKAVVIWQSKDRKSGKRRWDRTFKSIK
jgi:signal peptidase I